MGKVGNCTSISIFLCCKSSFDFNMHVCYWQMDALLRKAYVQQCIRCHFVNMLWWRAKRCGGNETLWCYCEVTWRIEGRTRLKTSYAQIEYMFTCQDFIKNMLPRLPVSHLYFSLEKMKINVQLHKSWFIKKMRKYNKIKTSGVFFSFKIVKPILGFQTFE